MPSFSRSSKAHRTTTDAQPTGPIVFVGTFGSVLERLRAKFFDHPQPPTVDERIDEVKHDFDEAIRVFEKQ